MTERSDLSNGDSPEREKRGEPETTEKRETSEKRGEPETLRAEAAKILRDSVRYGVEYGAEDGLEETLSVGGRRGIETAIESALINGTEEAVGDVLSEELPPGSAVEKPLSESDEKKKKFRKRLIFWTKIGLSLLVLGWIFWRLYEAAAEIRHYDWTLHAGWIAAAGAIYLAAYFPAASFWYLALKWMGQKTTFFHAVRAFYFSQLGKYIPGKAMVVVIRSGMVASERVKLSVAAVCVFYETLTMMMTGAFLSALIVFIWFGEHWRYSLLALGAMVVSGLPLIPPIFLRILYFLKIGKNDPELCGHLRAISWRNLGVGFLLMSILWLLFGLSLYAAIHGIGVVTGAFLTDIPRFISATALAIVLGFAVPISPGGLGIREAVLTILLIPYFEAILNRPENASVHLQAETLALVVSLEQRIVSIVAELSLVAVFLVSTGFGRLWGRFSKKTKGKIDGTDHTD